MNLKANHKNNGETMDPDTNRMEEEINIKREHLKERLEEIKRRRDDFFQKSREFGVKRDELNEKVSEYLARIQEYRELRNDLNSKVQVHKEEKSKIAEALEVSDDDDLRQEVMTLQEKIRANATNSQDYHKQIMEMNQKMNEIKTEANAFHEKYHENKVKSDDLQREFTNLSSEIYNLTKITNEMGRQRGFAAMPQATELENQAIMERSNYKRKADLFREAAVIRDQKQDVKGAMNDWANYFLIKANILSRENKFMVAKKYFDCAENLFLKTDQKKSAFYTTLQKVRSINIKLKKLLYHKKEHEMEIQSASMEEIGHLLEKDFGEERDYIAEKPVIPREDLSLQETFELYFSELERFFEVYQEFATEKQYVLRQISYHNKKAIFHQRRKDLESELKCYSDSIDFLESIDINTQEKSWFKSTIKKQKACFYFIKGKVENDFAKSAEFYKNAATLWRTLGNEKSELYNLAYHNYALGRLYELENLQKAKIHYGKAIEIWDRLNNTLSKKYTYAYYYHVIARIAEHENDLIKAKNYYIKAAELWKELGNEKSEKYNFAYLNHVYAKERSESEESIKYYQKAMDLWRDLGNTNSERFNLAHFYHAKAKFAQSPEEKMEFYQKASKVWEDMGNEKSKLYNLAYYYETRAKSSSRPEELGENWKKARELWGKVNEKRNAQYCEANYLSGSGMYFIYNNDLEKGRDMLTRAEETFTTLGIRDSALFSRYHYVKSYEFEMKDNQAWDLDLYISKLEAFLEDFKEQMDNPRYVDRKISYYKNMALIARKNKDLAAAMEYTEKCYQYCQDYYKATHNEALKQDYYYHKSVYNKILAKRLIAGNGDPIEIKTHLQKACQYMEKVDSQQSYVEWSYYYKYLAWLTVPDEESFDSYLQKAVKFAKNARNQKLEIALEGFELEGKAFREDDIDGKITFFRKALEKYQKISDYEKIQCISEMTHYLTARSLLFKDDIPGAHAELHQLDGKSCCALDGTIREKDYEIVDFVSSSHLLSVYGKMNILASLHNLVKSPGKDDLPLEDTFGELDELIAKGGFPENRRTELDELVSRARQGDSGDLEKLRDWQHSHLKEEFETRRDTIMFEKENARLEENTVETPAKLEVDELENQDDIKSSED